jgi:Putative DNA-binding domain
MPLDTIPLDSVSEEDLKRLVEDHEQESKTIEFKVELPGSGYEEHKKFIAGITSFANTVGGDLIYGVEAPNGVAKKVLGLNGDLDAAMSRLENLIQTAIQPRVTAYSLRLIPLSNGNKVLVFRISRSWALPHRVTLGGHDKFYGRNSTSKYELDVPQLRSLFLLSETTADRIRNFRAERVSLILSDQTTVSLRAGPKTVLHVVPFNAFGGGQTFPVSKIYDQNFLPILPPGGGGGGVSKRHNFDGIVTYSHMGDDPSPSYLQLFRTGIIESVDTGIIQVADMARIGMAEGQITIWGESFERQVLGDVQQYLNVQGSLGVTPPVVIMLSLLTVKGAFMYTIMPFKQKWIDREHLLVPEVMAETFTVDVGELLKPVFDVVWNACGYAESPFYESDGKRKAGK